MSGNLLENGGFEADWAEEKSHRCLVLPKGADPYETDTGNIFTPPGWVTWFRHDPGTWDQPEVRDARATHDARRVHSGEKAMLLFTFYRKHDAGFLQQVHVAPGQKLRLSAWAHAWSNLHGRPHEDDPRWSEGPGYDAGYLLAGERPPEGSPGTYDDWMNFTFSIGIDPTGGTNPFADAVVWGRGAHIYNEYAQVPAVEATAETGTVTVFLRSKTLWAFKHNDAYWDDVGLAFVDAASREARLTFELLQPSVGDRVGVLVSAPVDFASVDLVVNGPDGAEVSVGSAEAGQEGGEHVWRWAFVAQSAGTYKVRFSGDGRAPATARGVLEVSEQPGQGWVPPRVPYARVYVLLPQDAGPEWVTAVLESGKWEERHWTIGSSADDAGVGPAERTVIAVNPGRWSGDLLTFFDRYYPGVEYVPIEADTPAELRQKLRQM